MAHPEPTEINRGSRGEEVHESWALARFNRVSGNPGAKLFDSEIRHQHYITFHVTRASRRRDLHRDWIHPERELIEISMSEAQFGALVSSFGQGAGVPVTLSWFEGELIPQPVNEESRLGKSHEEVKTKHAEGLAKIKEAQALVQDAFDRKLGVKVTRERLATLQRVIDQMPGNMEFAAKSLSEHSENVTTKMKADIEGMILNTKLAIEGIDSSSLYLDQG